MTARTRVVRRAAPRDEDKAMADQWAQPRERADAPESGAVAVPADWRKGMLLNVRNHGDAYVVTLHPEELHPDHPERALHFRNPARCQDFVSSWYASEHHDPRAR